MLKLFQIWIVSSPLKYFLWTRSDDLWPLFEFTCCEKQKYQVTLCKLEKISAICLLLTHELLQNTILISFMTSHHCTEKNQCIICNCHNPLQAKNHKPATYTSIFIIQSAKSLYNHRTPKTSYTSLKLS